MKATNQFHDVQFQLTAARRRLGDYESGYMRGYHVSTHSRPKAAGDSLISLDWIVKVSTHSRPKAAGFFIVILIDKRGGFNSQLPEGGWSAATEPTQDATQFQLTAAQRRLSTIG